MEDRERSARLSPEIYVYATRKNFLNLYRITIANGPGRKTQTGGVSPDGPARSQLSMRLPEPDMVKVALALGDYIHAYETAHHHRIVADRVRQLRDKLATRTSRPET